jgi:hypothetical protein
MGVSVSPGGPGTPPTEDGDEGEAKFTGAIESLPAGSLIGIWMVAGKQVEVVSTTRLEQEEGGFAIGTIVEVEGLADATGVIVASKIEVESEGTPMPQPEPAELEIDGTIEALPASGLVGTWQVSGRTVVVSGTTVAIAMAGMFAIRSDVFNGIASGTITVVACAVAGSVTVLPAVLELLGTKIDRFPRQAAASSGSGASTGNW